MALWKKSEDPWDRKPGRDWLDKPKEPKEPRENPVDKLKQWNEKRKADVEAQFHRSPRPCPWCGKEMEQGYLSSGRGIWWAPGIPSFAAKWISADLAKGAARVDSDGVWATYKISWLCRDCGKMVFDVPEEERVYDFPEDQDGEISETTQEEETSED